MKKKFLPENFLQPKEFIRSFKFRIPSNLFLRMFEGIFFYPLSYGWTEEGLNFTPFLKKGGGY
jgi:hypothetical protein